MKKVFLVLCIMLIAGCSAPKKYYKNNNYTGNIQALLNRDMAYCQAVAENRIPTKPFNFQGDVYANTQGNAYMWDNNGNSAQGFYSGNTTYSNSMSNLNNMYQIADRFRAYNNQDAIKNMCLSQLGWYQISEQEYLNSTKSQSQMNRQSPTPTQAQVDAHNKAFQERINTDHPDFVSLSKERRRAILDDMRVWIAKMPYDEAKQLMEIYDKGTAEQVSLIISRYKRENNIKNFK